MPPPEPVPKQIIPYASELFGVYSPLIGWKSRLTKTRMTKYQSQVIQNKIQQAANEQAVRQDIYSNGARVWKAQKERLAKLPTWMDGPVSRVVSSMLHNFIKENKRVPQSREDWDSVINERQLNSTLSQLSRNSDTVSTSNSEVSNSRSQQSIDQVKESVLSGTLSDLSKRSPEVLYDLVNLPFEELEAMSESYTQAVSRDGSELANSQGLLSPIGVLQLFRQYFSDLGTILGPPVSHVWVGPRSDVELYEVHTRKTIQERELQMILETTSKSESSVSTQEDISDAVKDENQQDIKLGTAVSGGGGIGVYHADASLTYGKENMVKHTSETAHKQTHQQTQKLTSEIRRNFKTTFKTTVQVEDQSSRRHVIRNLSGNLLNYELRRKMRKVKVSLQRLGTRLCWQVFLDNPGVILGISDLIFVAKPQDVDGSSVIEGPKVPYPASDLTVPYQVDFKFKLLEHSVEGRGPQPLDIGPDNTLYTDGVWRDEIAEKGSAMMTLRVEHIQKFIGPKPPNGDLELKDVIVKLSEEQKTWNVIADPKREISKSSAGIPDNTFTITLPKFSFRSKNSINLQLNLIYGPTDAAIKRIDAINEQKSQEFSNAQAAEEHGKLVSAVRERIKVASKVNPRPEDDLREEERTVIYRQLIDQLLHHKAYAVSPQDRHFMSELIRSVFDIDSMLYFVAQEWWAAKPIVIRGEKGAVTSLTEEDKVGWDGNDPYWGERTRRYMITEDSEPAKFGASLGWLLQLDGDFRRNVFLNSPWVKAVIPIRPEKEQEAIEWLSLVEGSDNLDRFRPEIEKFIEEINITAKKEIEDPSATDKYFEQGFDPMSGGFKINSTVDFEVFDSWTVILPTDQIVAVEFKT
jgi:hypothetical protein